MLTVFEKNRVDYVFGKNKSVNVLYCEDKKVIKFYGDEKGRIDDNIFEENYKKIIEEFLKK